MPRPRTARRALALGITLTACEPNPEPPDMATDWAIVQDDVVVVPGPVADEAIVLPDEIRLPAAMPDAFIDDLQPGAVVVAPPASGSTFRRPSATNPFGFLRRVTAIELVDGEYRLHTTDASLLDYFKDGSFSAVAKGWDVETIEIVGDQESISWRAYPWEAILDVPTPANTLIKASKVILHEKDGLKIVLDRAYLTFKSKIDFAAGILPTHFLLRPSVDYDAGLSLSVQAASKRSFPPLKKTLVDNKIVGGFIIPVGPVPLSFTLRLTVEITCSGSVDAAITAGSAARFTGNAGVEIRYADKHYSTKLLNTVSDRYDVGTTQAAANLIVKCDVPRSRLSVLLFDGPGGYLEVAPTVSAELHAGSAVLPGSNCGIQASIAAGFRIAAGVAMKLFGKSYARDFPYSKQWPLWSRTWDGEVACGDSCGVELSLCNTPFDCAAKAPNPTCKPGDVGWIDGPCDKTTFCKSPLAGKPCVLAGTECLGVYDDLGVCAGDPLPSPACGPEDCGWIPANCAGEGVKCTTGCLQDCQPGAACPVPGTDACQGVFTDDCFCDGAPPPAPACALDDCGEKPGNCTDETPLQCGSPLQGQPCVVDGTVSCDGVYDCAGTCVGDVPPLPACGPPKCGILFNCAGSVDCAQSEACECGNGILQGDEECEAGCIIKAPFYCDLGSCTIECDGPPNSCGGAIQDCQYP